MDDSDKAPDEQVGSLPVRAARAKKAIEGLSASTRHIEVYDILGEFEAPIEGGFGELMSRLSLAIADTPRLKKILELEFGEAFIAPKNPSKKDVAGAIERMLERHGALDVEDLERLTGRLEEKVDHLSEELGRARKSHEVAVRLSNIFAFVAIVLGLLLLVSGIASDYLALDSPTSIPMRTTEEVP